MPNILESAFPTDCLEDLLSLKRQLELNILDEYQTIIVNHLSFKIPYRIYNKPFTNTQISALNQHKKLILFCIFTRHHDGFVRHKMVKNIMEIHPILKEDDFVIPYIFILLGEYVVEICIDLYPYIEANKLVILKFLKENKKLSYLTYQRSVSYWNEFHRTSRYKYLRDYPARKVFDLFPFVYRKKSYSAN